jgi:serine/threonine protein kinase
VALDASDPMAAPTEPALPLAPDTAIAIKRATLLPADQAGDEPIPSSRRLRNIESYVGFIVDGRYHIESVLAQGGMGVVYFARHRLIDKPVALKILRPELVHNREITARFLTEAQAASSIGSEHIVDVTDYGELPDGATYIVMEYLDGYSLNQRMKRCEGGLLPLPTILSIAREIAEGLQQAHDANIVHRDLKPDNILLIRKGKREDFVKILDFGIAKVLSSQNQTTTAGRIFGTPHYMSPEQGRGDELDHRTDIYSLGVILYEMVTGHVPFDGDNPLGILTQHMYVEVEAMSENCAPERTTPALECVVARCLMKDPKHRYNSMAELDEDLRRLQHLETPLAWDYFKQGNAPVPEYLRAGLRLPTKKRRISPGLVAVMMGTAGLSGWVLFGPDFVSPPQEIVQLPEPTTAPTTSEPLMVVNLAVEPIDAEVYRGTENLGTSPLLIQLLPGQTELLTLKRAGYKPYHLKVDGSAERYAIRMVPVPGPAASPPAPAPLASAEAAPTRVVDLRTAAKAQWSPIVSQDGGVPQYLNELFRTESEAVTSSRPPTQNSPTSVPLALPPQDMDPRFAPLPPGPPPGNPPGPPSMDELSPSPPNPTSSAKASAAPPPGPPPVDD